MADAVSDVDCVTVGEKLFVCVAVAVSDADCVPDDVNVPVGENVRVAVTENEGVNDGDGDGDGDGGSSISHSAGKEDTEPATEKPPVVAVTSPLMRNDVYVTRFRAFLVSFARASDQVRKQASAGRGALGSRDHAALPKQGYSPRLPSGPQSTSVGTTVQHGGCYTSVYPRPCVRQAGRLGAADPDGCATNRASWITKTQKQKWACGCKEHTM